MARKQESFRTIYCDPGEDFGWVVGRDTKLLAGGTTKMWDMARDVWAELNGIDSEISNPSNARDGVGATELKGEVGRIVCEDFRIYPWKAAALKWDQVRTARVIGALTFMCLEKNIPLVLQGANIKKAAVAAGAEELFWRPLKENRHQNDALMHFSFYTNCELLGVKLEKPDGYDGSESYH